MIQSFLNKHILNMLHQNSGQQLALVEKNHAAIGKMSNLKIGFFFFLYNRELSKLFPLCESFHFYRVPLMSRVSEIVCIFAGIYVHTLFLMTTLLVIKITGPKLGKYS